MVIKINEYYSHEIDKLKEGWVDDNYNLKSRYLFIVLYLLMICVDIITLSNTINIVTVLIFATPLSIGTYIELLEMKKYEGLNLGLEKIRKLLSISVVRMINIYLSLASGILILGKDVFASFLYENNYKIGVNTILVIVIILIYIFSVIAFFISVNVERADVKGDKRKKYMPTAILGTSVTLGILLFRNVSYSYYVIISICIEVIFAYGIGKIYFRYKNFDKKVTENNNMIDYKL